MLRLIVGCAAILPGSRLHSTRPARRTGLAPHCSSVIEEARAPDVPLDTDIACTLSSFEARALLALRDSAPSSGAHSVAGPHSLDLGSRQASSLLVLPDGVALEEAAVACVTWAELERITKREGAWKCYHGHLGYEPDRVEGFSEATRRAASLLPLDGAEATVVYADLRRLGPSASRLTINLPLTRSGPHRDRLGGFGMHRFAKGVHPGMDTAEKLRALQARGDVLDCCTGLGYTAIGAARSERVSSGDPDRGLFKRQTGSDERSLRCSRVRMTHRDSHHDRARPADGADAARQPVERRALQRPQDHAAARRRHRARAAPARERLRLLRARPARPGDGGRAVLCRFLRGAAPRAAPERRAVPLHRRPGE